MPPDSELESPTFIKKICKQTDRSKAFFSMTCEREVSDNTSDVEYKLKGFTFLINRWDFIFFFTFIRMKHNSYQSAAAL